MEEDFEEDFEREDEYTLAGWSNNVDNCNIDESRTVMICEDRDSFEYAALEAGIVIGEIGIEKKTVEMCSCGTWLWITFDCPETAVAFKLRWV